MSNHWILDRFFAALLLDTDMDTMIQIRTALEISDSLICFNGL